MKPTKTKTARATKIAKTTKRASKPSAKSKAVIPAAKTQPITHEEILGTSVTTEQVQEKVLVLRSCKADMTSYDGFKWPESGFVEAPDWKPTKQCGNGLHGWQWAVGDFRLGFHDRDTKWLVIEVDKSQIVELDGKVKFKNGNVIKVGNWHDCFWYVRTHTPKPVLEKPAPGDYAHSSTTGNYAHSSTTGDYAHSSTTGYSAHSSTTGYYAYSSTTGYYAHSSTSGYYAHSSTTGNYAHSSTTGYYAHSSTTGDYAHSSTTGNYATACALGTNCRAKAGDKGSIILTYWDDKANRFRHVIGYVGEDGIEANTWYEIQDGKLGKCSRQDY